MGALYIMRYLGQADSGRGSVYFGKGMIVGSDVGGVRYMGTYRESGGRVRGNMTLTAAEGPAMLVTGRTLPTGHSVPLAIDWPSNFYNGSTQQVTVMGRPIRVTFEKIADIP